MIRWFATLVILLCAQSAAAQSTTAQTDQRIALVVGNGAYRSVSALDNPVSDARLIAGTLVALGFKVTLITDATQPEMSAAIGAFGKALRAAGPEATGLFYYAGHGVQSFKTNYILPVDVALTDPADLALVAVEAESVLRQMFSARNRTNIVILDACRNNPFQNVPDLGDAGLAEMKAPTGTFLAYATEPGAVAQDGAAGNSPFTAALAQEMQVAGLPVEQMFKQVRVRVIQATNGAQTPWDTSSLTADFSFNPAVVPTADEVAARQLWESVAAQNDPVQIMLFLRAYPASAYEVEARALLDALMTAEALAATAPADPPLVDPPPAETALEQPEPEVVPGAAATAEPGPQATMAGVRFDQPLTGLDAGLDGNSIEKLLGLTPLYSPIEGLDDSVWKDKPCTECHLWTREALCVQAGTYLQANADRALSKAHPFGGNFKLALRSWAEAGCQ